MNVQQIYTSCLSQAAYFIESDGVSAVIDPLRDVDRYIKLAEKYNSKIKYVFETHFHADFVSGHLTLAKKTNAKIVFGPESDPNYDAIICKENQVFKIGKLSLTAIHTPGHTLESTSYLLFDENGKQKCIFTGDTFFLGDVGIPDVAQRYKGVSKEELAGILYDSINKKIKPLDKDILIYPGHGAGSACGKKMMKKTVDTLENQLKLNYSINGSFSREQFVEELTTNLPEPPSYFPANVKLNQDGCTDIDDVLKKALNPLSVDEFVKKSNKNKHVIIDTRTNDEFKQGHIPKSLFFGLNGQFASWVGSVIKNTNTKILLVTSNGKEMETVQRLSRIGFDSVTGFLEGGFKSWINSKKEISIIDQTTPKEVGLIDSPPDYIDVRKRVEFEEGCVKNALNIPLDYIDDYKL
ncbi:MAG: MBL fold metallo-hydrolase, partial [Flavobacteriales bacterium]|nr:MBL fold metallo-hydrolase [Flavobacteriales bacterium]